MVGRHIGRVTLREASQGGYSRVNTSQGGLSGWLFPVNTLQGGLPGWVIPGYIPPGRPLRVGYTLLYTPQGGLSGWVIPYYSPSGRPLRVVYTLFLLLWEAS